MEERLAFLRDDRDQGSHLLRLLDDVESEDVHPARRRDEEGRRDPEEGRLPGGGGRRLRVAAGELVAHHDEGVPDPDRGVHDGSVGPGRPVDFLGPERLLVEFDGPRGTVDHKVRRHGSPSWRDGTRAGRLRLPCSGRLPLRRRSFCSSSHVGLPAVRKTVPHLRMSHATADVSSGIRQRPIRTSSTNSPRILRCRRRTPSSTKPRDLYRRRARSFVANTVSSAFAKPRSRIHSRRLSIIRRPRPTSRQPSWIAMPIVPTWRSFGKVPPWQSAAPITSPSATATNRTFRTPSKLKSHRRSSSRLSTFSTMM